MGRTGVGPWTSGATLPVIWAVLVISTVAWRQGSFYSGGADPVVILKAALQVSVLLWAILLNLGRGPRFPLPAGVPAILLIFVLVSCVGGYAGGHTVASGVIAVRILMLATTMTLMFRVHGPEANLRALLTAMGCVGVLSAGSGLLFGEGGRLSGGLPPLSPNEIALLVGAPLLALVHEMIRDRLHAAGLTAFMVLAAVLVLTESRSAMGALALGMVLILLQIRRLPLRVVASAAVLVPVVFVVLAYTPLIPSLVFRADSASLSTLNSRTISWNAVLDIPVGTWQRWIGSGLSTKEIAVSGQYWDTQVFDSSWFSALAQAGIVGAALMALWAGWAVVATCRRARIRTLTLGLLVFLLVRSVLENGLVDASVAFMLFFCLSMMAERPVYERLASWEEASPWADPARREMLDPAVDGVVPAGRVHR